MHKSVVDKHIAKMISKEDGSEGRKAGGGIWSIA